MEGWKERERMREEGELGEERNMQLIQHKPLPMGKHSLGPLKTPDPQLREESPCLSLPLPHPSGTWLFFRTHACWQLWLPHRASLSMQTMFS